MVFNIHAHDALGGGPVGGFAEHLVGLEVGAQHQGVLVESFS
jgi:hypothetical protein